MASKTQQRFGAGFCYLEKAIKLRELPWCVETRTTAHCLGVSLHIKAMAFVQCAQKIMENYFYKINANVLKIRISGDLVVVIKSNLSYQNNQNITL